MITVEDCRRKATEGLDKAQAASDPKTIATLRRASNAWEALAQRIEEADLRQHSHDLVRRPADLAKLPDNPSFDSVQIGDVLRERLRLSDDADVE
jgi:hypothetical protein